MIASQQKHLHAQGAQLDTQTAGGRSFCKTNCSPNQGCSTMFENGTITRERTSFQSAWIDLARLKLGEDDENELDGVVTVVRIIRSWLVEQDSSTTLRVQSYPYQHQSQKQRCTDTPDMDKQPLPKLTMLIHGEMNLQISKVEHSNNIRKLGPLNIKQSKRCLVSNKAMRTQRDRHRYADTRTHVVTQAVWCPENLLV